MSIHSTIAVPTITLFKTAESLRELNSYLAAKEPTLSFHHFSFRPKVMGAPKDQEKVRGERETVVIFPKMENL